MARRLDAFPAPASQRYPWQEWLNGDVWELFADEDYKAKTQTLVQTARTRAKRLGGTVRTRILNDGERESLIIQYVRAMT